MAAVKRPDGGYGGERGPRGGSRQQPGGQLLDMAHRFPQHAPLRDRDVFIASGVARFLASMRRHPVTSAVTLGTAGFMVAEAVTLVETGSPIANIPNVHIDFPWLNSAPKVVVPPVDHTPTPGPTSTPEVTPLDKVAQADVQQMQKVRPHDTFSYKLDQASGTIVFYDESSSASEPIAVSTPSGVQMQDIYLNSQMQVTNKGQVQTLRSLTFVGGTGNQISHDLALSQQASEVTANSKTISVMNPLDVPPGTSVQIFNLHIVRTDGSKTTVVIYQMHLPNGGTATLLNNNDGKMDIAQGGKLLNVGSDGSVSIGNAGLNLSPANHPRGNAQDIEYFFNVDSLGNGVTSKTSTTDGQVLTAEAYSVSSTDATPFSINNEVVMNATGK